MCVYTYVYIYFFATGDQEGGGTAGGARGYQTTVDARN